MKGFLCVALIAALVAGPALADNAWTSMGTGVSIQHGGSPCRIAIFFGGYGYAQTDSQNWMTHVASAAGFDAHYGIKDFIAVKGPADSMYRGHEISNSHIVAYLKGLTQCTGNDLKLLVADHSSGGFVMAEWIGQMLSSFPSALSNTILYDLDGGAPPAAAAKHLRNFFPTSTIKPDGTLTAMNYGSVHQLCTTEGIPAPQCRFINVRGAENSGCITFNPSQKGVGNWCLHMFTVNQRPHSQSLANKVYLQDLENVNAQHPIQTDWIEQTRNELAALFGAAAPTPAAPALQAVKKFKAGAPFLPGVPTPKAAFIPGSTHGKLIAEAEDTGRVVWQKDRKFKRMVKRVRKPKQN